MSMYSLHADYLWLNARDLPAARSALQKALEIAPQNPSLRLKWAQLDYIAGDKASAKSLLLELRGEPFSPGERETLNNLLNRLEDTARLGAVLSCPLTSLGSNISCSAHHFFHMPRRAASKCMAKRVASKTGEASTCSRSRERKFGQAFEIAGVRYCTGDIIVRVAGDPVGQARHSSAGQRLGEPKSACLTVSVPVRPSTMPRQSWFPRCREKGRGQYPPGCRRPDSLPDSQGLQGQA